MLAGTVLALALVVTTFAASTPAQATPPSAPTGVIVTPGKKTMLVQWTGSGGVDHYVATSSAPAKSCTVAGANQCTITGLNANTAYTVTVVACASADNSDCSAASNPSASATPGPPIAPAKPTVAYNGNSGEVLVSWVIPAQPGASSAISSFQVTPTPAVANASGTCAGALGAGANSCVFGNLVAGTSYTFKVTSVGPGATGSSVASTASNAIVAGPPGKSGTPEVTRSGNGNELLISWTAPTTGAPPVDYLVTANHTVTLSTGCGTNPNIRSCTAVAADPSLSHTFQVQARGGGDSVLSDASDAITPGKPGKPGTPTVEVTGSGAATVSWTETEESGSAVHHYTLVANPSSGVSVSGGCGTDPTVLTCTVTGMNPATPYTFTVTAVSATPVSTASDASAAVLAAAPGAPAAPTVVVNSSGNATVSWNAPGSGGQVNGYTVISDPSATIPAGCGDDIAVRTCTFTGLSPTTAYTFVVEAVGPAGYTDSPASTAVVPGPPGTPGTPAVALVADGSVTVTWTAPGSGGPVSGYTLTSNYPITVPGGCTANLSCTLTGLNPTLAYTFTVTANGPAGNTASAVSSPSIKPTVPGVPGTPAVTLNSPGNVTVTWTAPTTGGPVTSYTLSSNQSITVPGGCTANLSCTLTGLNQTLPYTFLVTANGPIGGGTASAASSAAVVPAAAGAAGTPTVTLTSPGHATVAWTAPTTGGPVTSYTLTSNQAFSLPANCTDLNVRSCVFTNLDPTLSYTFQVNSTGPAGSTASGTSTAVIPDKPGASGTPTVTLTSPGHATVAWTAPTTGGPLVSYTLNSNQAFNLPANCTALNTRSCVFTDLNPALSYTFHVDSTGPAGFTSSGTSTAVIPDKPGAPGTPTVQNGAPGSVTVSWTAPTTGGPLTSYSVTSVPVVTPPNGCTATAQLSCVFSGLDPNETYAFTVTATGPAGDTASANSDQVTPGAPRAPGTPTVVVVASGTARVTWTASPVGGGVPNGYTVTSDPVVTPPAGCVLVSALTCDFTGLDPTKSYTFAVTAIGGSGRTTSVARSAPIVPGPAGVPGTPTAVLTAAGTAKVSWTRPLSGGPVTSFSVTSDPVVAPPASCTAITVTSCDFTGLDPAVSYTFLVTANGSGGNTPSAARSAAVLAGAPGAPGKPTVATTGPGAVTVTWTAPSTGGQVATYAVTSSPGVPAPNGCTAITQLTCVYAGLDAGTSYTFVVTATGPGGSTPSAASDAIIPSAPNPPGTPTVTAWAPGTVRVAWAASPAGGGAVTGYTVTSDPVVTPPAGCVVVNALTCDFTGLDSTKSYTFAVTAVGAAGRTTSVARSPAVIPAAAGVPGTPTAVVAGAGSAKVSWTPPVGGGPVSSYSVTSDPVVTPPAACTQITATTCVFTGLDASVSYTFLVTANGQAGNTPSAARSAAVLAAAPGAPATPTVTSAGPGAVTVQWAAPTTGGQVTSYSVTSSPAVPAPSGCTAITQLTCVFSGLDAATSYAFVVTATGPGGSTPSAASGQVTPSAPNPPGTPTAVIWAPGTVRVAWTASPAGGGAVTGYTVTSDPAVTPPAGCVLVNALTCDFTGLDQSKSYTFAVTAVGAAGRTTSVARSAAIIPGPTGVPGTPTAVLTAADTAKVSWTRPLSGGPVTSFSVTSDPVVAPPASCTAITVTSCDFTGLDPAVSYTFLVTANGVGGNTASAARSAAVLAGVPGAPGKPTVASTGPGAVTVQWAAPSTGGQVASYAVTSSPAVPVPNGCTATTQLICVYAGLDAATSYTFVVTATGPGGSTPSVGSDAIVPSAPNPPGTPTVAVVASGTARVTWTASPVGGGVPNGYTVTSDPAVTPPAGCVLITALTCDFTGLDSTKSYTFAVTAVGGSGRTTSVARSAPIVPGPAGVPGTPTAVLTAAGTAKVSWTRPLSGGPVTSFSVTSDPVVTPPAGCTAITTTSCDFTGLDPAVSYTFLVTANGSGGNTPSAARSAAVLAGAPGAPGKPTVATTGPGAVTVSWAAPSTGGQVATYAVTSSPAVPAPNGCTATTQFTCVYVGLDAGTSYTFVVTATGPGGSTPSVGSDAIIPSAPNPPGTPTVAVVSSGTARVTWTASPAGGGAVTGYTVTSDPAVTPPAGCVLITALTCDFTGLDPSKSYTFAVTAVGSAGRTTSVARSAAIIPGPTGVPGTPTVTVTVAGTAKVSWTRPFGGGPVTGYSVTSDPAVTPPASCTAVMVTSCDFTGLDPATSYTFLVTANGLGGSTPSAAHSAAVVPGVPGAPGTPTVALSGPGAVTVQWTAPTTGGSVSGYTVISDPASTAPPGCTQVLALECTFDRLNSGTSYTFKVVATGPVGRSATSAASAAVIPGPPSVPGRPTVASTDVTNQVRVAWTAPTDGVPVAGYAVLSTPGDRGCDTPAGPTATSCLVSNLEPAVAYTFRVRALGVGQSGDSAFGPRSDVITPGALAAPTEVDVSAGDRQIAVSWTPPSNATGRVAFYRATADLGGYTCTTTSASGTDCVITGLYNLTSYTVTVVAVGITGVPDSPPSAPVRVRPTAGAPGAPTNVVAVGRDQGVTISWRAPVALGDGVNRYVATVSGDPDGLTCVTAETTCAINGLVNGRTYKVTVVAVGRAASGTSVPSAPVGVTLDTVPSVPTGVIVTVGSSDLTVRFTAGVGGGTVATFTATATAAGGGSGGSCTTVGATPTTCVITGVTPGTSYTVSVVANSATAGMRSAASAPSSPVTALAAPAPPLPAAMPTSTTAMTSSGGANLKMGAVTTIVGTGFQPFSGITVGSYPGPVTFATTTTDANGGFSVQVTISGGTTGSRTLVAAGTKSAQPRYQSLAVTVTAAASANASSVNTVSAAQAAADLAEIRKHIGPPVR